MCESCDSFQQRAEKAEAENARLRDYIWQLREMAKCHTGQFRNLAEARGAADPGLMYLVEYEEKRQAGFFALQSDCPLAALDALERP